MAKDMFSVTREGISQQERWLETLVPDYIKIDSREIPDLVRFTYELSKNIHYYNNQNRADGTWDDFFTADANIVAILVSRYDLNGTGYEFGQKRQQVLNATGDKQIVSRLAELIRFLADLLSRLFTMRKRFKDAYNYTDVARMVLLLEGLEEEAMRLRGVLIEARSKFGLQEEETGAIYVPEFSAYQQAVREVFVGGNSIKEQVTSALPSIIRIFDALYSRLNLVVKACAGYVKEQRFIEKSYAPQMGLYITFLELYTHLRNRINGITRRHLDYYYRELLNIRLQSSRPDVVHLIIEPEEQSPHIVITPDDLLLAEVSGAEFPLYYKPLSRQQISRARIADLKSVFVSHYTQIIAEEKKYRDVHEVQVYSAQLPLFKAADYQKKNGEVPSWPVMGEDQHDLAESERTMDNAEPGFAIASPLFYQTDGERTFKISLHLRPSVNGGLADYIDNFSGVSGKSRETVIHELFSTAFVLHYSGAEGWLRVKKYRVETQLAEDAVFVLAVSFTIGLAEPAFGEYKDEIHQKGLKTTLPVLQLLMNNFVEHHPYGLLRTMLFDRITINAQVKGFKSLKLQNNVGPLSPASPFQPFGPQPTVGSYLDIKNTNLFNRYLKNFSLRMEWLELPREKGGFASYYAGYGRKYTNSSFEINLSALMGSTYQPAEDLRQRFRLFSSDSDTEELHHISEIKGVDFRKIEFRNNPSLSAELENSETYFREGAIRLELCSPADAFGHRLFPQVFPDVIMNNTKKFRKKLPVPNQPHIPVIKTVEVDAELEYSEGFKEEKGGDGNFQLFHIFPFGYESIFPGGEQKNYWMLPGFPDSGNLYIGLENAEAGTELALLFQMEEKSFHHTLHEPDEVKWKYMESNTWVDFKSRDILSDTTGNFVNSGIVKLRLPSRISTGNTVLPGHLFWICASSAGAARLQSRVIAIAVNGITAERVPEQEEAKNNIQRLEAGVISNFARSVKGVQNVWQLFPSYGGRKPEDDQNYYVRVSERLRHKARPVLIRDIIQVILEEFPGILIAKCFNSENEDYKVLPGVNLQIILIPKESDDGKFISEQPRVSLSELYRVKSFISGLLSPFVKTEVGNAVYEKVKVFCNVLFSEDAGLDFGVLTRRFVADINQYIAPWLFGSPGDIMIGGRLYKSELLMFLKSRPYVRYITRFSLVHFFAKKQESDEEYIYDVRDSVVDRMDYVQGSSPASVLIPSSYHRITVLSAAEYAEPVKSGIGDFFIGEEFLVDEGAEQAEEEEAETTNEEEYFSLIITHNIE